MIQTKIINGKPHVKINDLRPNPTNKEIYTSSAISELVESFKKRKEAGKTPNLVPITYWEDGMIDMGHTRTEAAQEIGEEWIYAEPSDADMPNEDKPFDEFLHTLDGNTYRKKTWSELLGEYQKSKNSYREQFGLDMPSPLEKNLLKKKIGTTKKTIDMLTEIKQNKPELLKVIDAGGAIKHNWMIATGQLNSNIIPAKVNGLNISDIFKDRGVRSKLITKAVKYAQDMRNSKMSFEDFEVKPFSQDECGKWESGAFTTFLSHTFMSAMAGVLKELGYDVRTANGHRDDADIYLINEDEKIEVKGTQFNGHGAATKWSGGGSIREGKYFLFSHDLEFKNLWCAMCDLDRLDWSNPDMNQKKNMKLNTLYENHKDEIEIWKGDIQLIKTNKAKDGQVQMTLSPVNEPI